MRRAASLLTRAARSLRPLAPRSGRRPSLPAAQGRSWSLDQDRTRRLPSRRCPTAVSFSVHATVYLRIVRFGSCLGELNRTAPSMQNALNIFCHIFCHFPYFSFICFKNTQPAFAGRHEPNKYSRRHCPRPMQPTPLTAEDKAIIVEFHERGTSVSSASGFGFPCRDAIHGAVRRARESGQKQLHEITAQSFLGLRHNSCDCLLLLRAVVTVVDNAERARRSSDDALCSPVEKASTGIRAPESNSAAHGLTGPHSAGANEQLADSSSNRVSRGANWATPFGLGSQPEAEEGLLSGEAGRSLANDTIAGVLRDTQKPNHSGSFSLFLAPKPKPISRSEIEEMAATDFEVCHCRFLSTDLQWAG
jgi:hypothetical protein